MYRDDCVDKVRLLGKTPGLSAVTRRQLHNVCAWQAVDVSDGFCELSVGAVAVAAKTQINPIRVRHEPLSGS